MNADVSAPAPSRALSLLWLYAPLFCQTLLLFPLTTGMDGIFILISAVWLTCLFAGRLPRARRWLVAGLAALLLAAVTPFYFPHWRGNVGCPHCFEAEWRFLALDNATLAPWILWGLVALSLAVGTLMPSPRWDWGPCRKERGEIPLPPLLLLGFALILPLLMAAGAFWDLMAPVPDYGG